MLPARIAQPYAPPAPTSPPAGWTPMGRFVRPAPPRGRRCRPHPQGEKPAEFPVQAPTKYEADH